ncbi:MULTISPECIES: D-alanyl-D-alanine carboxypeptidase family protein [Vibrio]|jgi:D-alanyl-D-alanine carboxypeptidase (penicillin-binding protein 5/6)|uniref:D-alanyl-D-alanine carboxypeptidase family protein n=1 Tax=Vibrio TaxID=662 RepID=UPI0003913CA8|nr:MULTISPECIES: D-alanyl-D-alanine carboxypeptidase family protein [Vibrio]ERB64322.1 D-alanyl-D-alanine carboxypeptidase [Vibrio coralliilyticus OCN008]MCM5508656.1 D-alanyl-D-alanine carboxypeptidase [Vibrio sp. SCSIO 43169]NOH52173.1 D-alanyl-D-alanine carboxypeptidase [Vibrio coralliilyticus]NRF14385.1 D-alanyl-D-alanine carboxypeptidase [Vibrio coralliilyticus]NRF62053.1 D-alanyl-D-alanine carboxypeptidase [Vibrio coralliilyticus]
MKKTFLLKAALFSSIAATFNAIAAPTIIPEPPTLGAKGYVLIDYNTGQVLVEKNANTKLNPASLTKLMTAYVAGQEVKAGNITLDDQVVISKNAWAKNFPDSSKMFIEVGTTVPLMDLYRGLIVQSGNDASVAIAEYVAGSEGAFVNLMNSWAEKLGLENTAYTNPHGLDSNGLYSTPMDIAKLGQAIIRDLPDIYPLYSETSYTYNGITQYNRNGLLRDRSMNVDGMKTGYTSGAGYSLTTSATSGDMRLIAVVMGASSTKSRESESKQLLSYGFRFFETVSPTKAGDTVTEAKVWMGEQDQLSVGVNEDIYMTLPKGNAAKLTAEVEFDRELVAPITEGEKVGTIIYSVEGDEVATADLIAQADVDEGSLFKKLMDWFKRLISSWF